MGSIAVVGRNDVANAAVRRHLRDLGEVTVHSQDRPGKLPLSAARVIVIRADAITPGVVTEIRKVMDDLPMTHVLVVTQLTGKNVRLLSEVPHVLENVVGVEEITTTLRTRVRDSMAEHYLDRAVETITARADVSPLAKRFMMEAWRRSRPPTSVSATLNTISVRPSTLRDHWSFDSTPKTLVDWALLARAVVVRQTGVSWVRAASRVGISQRRLTSIARRRLACSLRDIDGEHEDWVEQRVSVR